MSKVIEKLNLSDSALQLESENSSVLGYGGKNIKALIEL